MKPNPRNTFQNGNNGRSIYRRKKSGKSWRYIRSRTLPHATYPLSVCLTCLSYGATRWHPFFATSTNRNCG